MEEMLPWGTVWNVDCKLKRESKASANFIFHIRSYFILKLFIQNLVSKSEYICLQRQ